MRELFPVLFCSLLLICHLTFHFLSLSISRLYSCSPMILPNLLSLHTRTAWSLTAQPCSQWWSQRTSSLPDLWFPPLICVSPPLSTCTSSPRQFSPYFGPVFVEPYVVPVLMFFFLLPIGHENEHQITNVQALMVILLCLHKLLQIVQRQRCHISHSLSLLLWVCVSCHSV